MRLFKNFDSPLFLSLILISILGLVIISSVAPDLFLQQLFYFFLGFVLFFFLSSLDFRIFEHLSTPLYFFSIIALFSTIFFGQITRGAIRWISIGTVSLQPSEFVKPFLIVFFASFFTKTEKLSAGQFFVSLLLLALPLFLIFVEPALGGAILVFVAIVGIWVARGLSLKQVISFFLLGIISLPIVWLLLRDYQRARILSFLNPYSDPLGAGYNMIQSVIAIGSGRIFGRGLGRGTQSHLAFLPERHTDFIFASLVEEFGLLGASFLLASYFFCLYRILKIGQNSPSQFGLFYCSGFFLMFAFQVFVNIGMNIGIIPITGITLPLVSYGGSSLVATMISLGIVESIARSQKPQGAIEIK